MPPQRMPCHPGNNEKWRKGDKQTHIQTHTQTATLPLAHLQSEKDSSYTQHLYFSGESSYIIIKQVAGCDARGEPETATEREDACQSRSRGLGRGRVMRKSRVVNLCDNILCETFLFLVQRELQRSMAQGRLSHPRRAGERQARLAGRQGDWGRCEGAEGCCGCACLRLTLAIARKMARTVCSLFLASPGKGKGKRQKKQQLWPVTCALLHTHTQGVGGCGGVCAVCRCCCGGAAVATFYCFCCIAKRITARCGKRQHRGWAAGGNGGLGAALFEEFMAFRDVSMCQASEQRRDLTQ